MNSVSTTSARIMYCLAGGVWQLHKSGGGGGVTELQSGANTSPHTRAVTITTFALPLSSLQAAGRGIDFLICEIYNVTILCPIYRYENVHGLNFL